MTEMQCFNMHKNVSFLSWNCWKYVDNRRKRRGRDSHLLQSQAQRLQRMQTPSSNGKPTMQESELHASCVRILRVKTCCRGQVWRLRGFVMWPFLEDFMDVADRDKTFPRDLNSLLGWMFQFFTMKQFLLLRRTRPSSKSAVYTPYTPCVLLIKISEQSLLSPLMSICYGWILSCVHVTLTFMKLCV